MKGSLLIHLATGLTTLPYPQPIEYQLILLPLSYKKQVACQNRKEGKMKKPFDAKLYYIFADYTHYEKE